MNEEFNNNFFHIPHSFLSSILFRNLANNRLTQIVDGDFPTIHNLQYL